MANATGRPIAPLVLSPDERACPERQVRRHRAARSLSERCGVILRCADGLPSKSVASELGFPANVDPDMAEKPPETRRPDASYPASAKSWRRSVFSSQMSVALRKFVEGWRDVCGTPRGRPGSPRSNSMARGCRVRFGRPFPTASFGELPCNPFGIRISRRAEP
jgi:hypothetical protein